MLVEAGFVRASVGEAEWTFSPSLGRIASLGTPHEIVALYAGLHGPKAAQEAAFCLAALCDSEDPSPLIGWRDEDGWHPGAMPEAEMVLVARHLLQHGIIGKARPQKPGAAQGEFSDKFVALDYITAARVHLGMSAADAEGMSMTEWQCAMEAKFPDAGTKKADVPSKDEYLKAKAKLQARRGLAH